MSYPAQPGFKRNGTSKDAAESMKPKAPTLRRQCLEAIRVRPMTADEVALTVRQSVLSIRPRLSELVKTEHIMNSGMRRPNMSGRMATIWELTMKGMEHG
jgi:predicted ArsR family transcriptional regulator